MHSKIIISYDVDGYDAEYWEHSVHENIMNMLHNVLPYMVDNVNVTYISENDEDYDNE
mgnify:CR=1 FL=1